MASKDHAQQNNSDRPGSNCESSREEPTSAPKVLRSDDLFAGGVEVMISHGEDIYRLRKTRNGKLILTK